MKIGELLLQTTKDRVSAAQIIPGDSIHPFVSIVLTLAQTSLYLTGYPTTTTVTYPWVAWELIYDHRIITPYVRTPL